MSATPQPGTALWATLRLRHALGVGAREYLKLQRSLVDGRIFDLPPQSVQRYLIDKVESPRMAWRFNHMLRSIETGKMLRVEVHGRRALEPW